MNNKTFEHQASGVKLLEILLIAMLVVFFVAKKKHSNNSNNINNESVAIVNINCNWAAQKLGNSAAIVTQSFNIYKMCAY